MSWNTKMHQVPISTSNGNSWGYIRVLLLLVVFVFSVSVFTRAFFWPPALKAQHFDGFLLLRAIDGGLGITLLLGGVGGFLGRAPTVVVVLLGKQDLNSSRSAIRDLLVSGSGAILGLLLLIIYLSGIHGT